MSFEWDSEWLAFRAAAQSVRSRQEVLDVAQRLYGVRPTWDAARKAWDRREGVRLQDVLMGKGLKSQVKNKPVIEPVACVKPPVRGGHSKVRRRHIFIPDTQCEPGAPDDHFTALGRFVVDKGFDVVVWGGDIGDYPSLSAYESGKAKVAAGRCKLDDIRCKNRALERYQNELVKGGFQPQETHVTYGNHDCRGPLGRPGRYLAENPEDRELFNSVQHIEDTFGWHLHEFLQPVEIDGIIYCHLFPFNTMGKQTQSALKMGAGNARSQIRAVMQSCTAGHSPGFDYAEIRGPMGRTHHGLIAGSFYQHKHAYNGNADYWQGVVVKNRVKDGDYDICKVSLEYLRETYL